MNRSHYIGGYGIACSRLGYTEIRNLYLAGKGDYDILRLDIPVNDMLFVSSLNTQSHLNGNAHSLFK